MKKKFSYRFFLFFFIFVLAAAAAFLFLSPKEPLPGNRLLHGLNQPYAAPEIAGIEAWLNSDPLLLAELRGKVVLVDFWTYSCINCIRSLPHVVSWYNAYKDDGFIVIGVHTPEFGFERKPENITRAIKKYGISYPVAIDNAWATWKAFQNQYWPAHYLIDREGKVVYTHFGEGDYDIMENNIRFLLDVGGEMAKGPRSAAKAGTSQSPETYLGYKRAKNFSSPESFLKNAPGTYTFPSSLPLHHWALEGEWRISPENITAASAGARLRYHFDAGKVFLVMGTADGKPVTADVYLNGVKKKSLTVEDETLYTLLELPSYEEGTVEIVSLSKGLQAYAFTFGQ